MKREGRLWWLNLKSMAMRDIAGLAAKIALEPTDNQVPDQFSIRTAEEWADHQTPAMGCEPKLFKISWGNIKASGTATFVPKWLVTGHDHFLIDEMMVWYRDVEEAHSVLIWGQARQRTMNSTAWAHLYGQRFEIVEWPYDEKLRPRERETLVIKFRRIF